MFKHHSHPYHLILIFVQEEIETNHEYKDEDITEKQCLGVNMATNMKETHGIEIPYSKKGIFKSQQKYFMDLLR